jgi:prepilin-type N-terminal cleavage/methylation domain-containing protein
VISHQPPLKHTSKVYPGSYVERHAQRTCKSMDNSSGFTIVELLIVIVVIGILAAISIVAYNGMQARARIGHYL